jgi:hypothetical protein
LVTVDQNFDFGKISFTAKLVAYFRTFSDIPFAAEVAETVKAREAFLEILGRLHIEDQKILHGDSLPVEGKVYGPLLEARYKSIIQLIKESEINHVLELASGFSLRGLAMAQDPKYVYVESDLSQLNVEKKKLVNEVRSRFEIADLGNHSIVDVNALHSDELDAALDRFPSHSEEIAIVNEGLLMYLSAEERATVATNVRTVLNKFRRGIWITPDFSTRALTDNVPDSVKRFRNAVFGATDRQIYDSAFDNEEAIEHFFASVGFTSECSNQLDVVPALSSLERLEIDQSILDRLKPRMRIWILKSIR